MDICRECQFHVEGERYQASFDYCGHPSQRNQHYITGYVPNTPCERVRVGPSCIMYQPKYTIRERIGDWIMNMIDKVWG